MYQNDLPECTSRKKVVLHPMFISKQLGLSGSQIKLSDILGEKLVCECAVIDVTNPPHLVRKSLSVDRE
jgi:hypothetical protein